MEELFQLPPTDAAERLLGCVLSYGKCSGIIVETEAYAEFNDEACHTFFRKTAREFVARHDAAAIYMYINYGVHRLLNFLTVTPEGERGFVLIRALEPIAGLEEMRLRRGKEKARDLCSGPGKLTQAMDMGMDLHEQDLATSVLDIFEGEVPENILRGPRIGISRAKNLPWRYGIEKHPCLSRSF